MVPGWNERCLELRKVARTSFLTWKENGKPRYGIYYENMKKSRTNFKKALKFCKENEIKIKKDKLLKSYAKNNKSDLKKTNKEIFNIVDGKTDKNEILNIFKEK